METPPGSPMFAGDHPPPEVLIVGAGPTGLLLAAELERRNVPCLLIDELDAPRGWDRATVVHERSLEIFEALGIVEPLISQGVKTRGALFHSDGEIIAELNLNLTAEPLRLPARAVRGGHRGGADPIPRSARRSRHAARRGWSPCRRTRAR